MKEAIHISFLGNDAISRKAEEFRKIYWDNSIPVEIEDIIDLKLKINIIPIPGLQDLCDTVTLITSDKLDIKSIENFYKFFEIISPEQYGYLEAQANKFANLLLVPRDVLVKEKEKIMKSVKNLFNINSVDSNTLNSYISRPLSNIFGVSDTTMEIALNQN